MKIIDTTRLNSQLQDYFLLRLIFVNLFIFHEEKKKKKSNSYYLFVDLLLDGSLQKWLALELTSL